MQFNKTVLKKVWIVLNKKCFIFLIYKKLEKRRAVVFLIKKKISSLIGACSFLCPFLICGDLLYFNLLRKDKVCLHGSAKWK